MALGIMKQSDRNVAYVNQYIADTAADVANLPTACSPGSSCIVISTGQVYMFNNKGQWKPLGSSGGGSSGDDSNWEAFEEGISGEEPGNSSVDNNQNPYG